MKQSYPPKTPYLPAPTATSHPPIPAPQATPIRPIIAPHGQRTTLTTDDTGTITSITNPNGKTTRFTYTEKGLISYIMKPLGQLTQLLYTNRGELLRDASSFKGGWNVQQSRLPDGMKVKMTDREGRVYQNQTDYGPDRQPFNYTNTAVAPDGTTTSTVVTKYAQTTTNSAMPGFSIAETYQFQLGGQTRIPQQQTVTLPSGKRYTLKTDTPIGGFNAPTGDGNRLGGPTCGVPRFHRTVTHNRIIRFLSRNRGCIVRLG